MLSTYTIELISAKNNPYGLTCCKIHQSIKPLQWACNSMGIGTFLLVCLYVMSCLAQKIVGGSICFYRRIFRLFGLSIPLLSEVIRRLCLVVAL